MEDEAAAVAAHNALLADNFTFLFGHDAFESWDDYVESLDRQARGADIEPGRVPASLLVATVDDKIVGRSSIRYALNDYLAVIGGHIGYAVLPEFRGHGFATEMLRQSLVIARSRGVDRVLVTCDDDNYASARVIEKCGGILESVVYRAQQSWTLTERW